MKIVCLDGSALNPGDLSWEPLEQIGEFTVYPRTEDEDQAAARIGDAEVLLVNKFPVTESLLERCPSVKCVCVLATGYNIVDCEAAKKRGIPVCNVPSYGTQAVAQFTFGLILEMCHRIGLHNHSVHQGDWGRGPDFCYWLSPQVELAGKTLGIIGFGAIGRAVGRLGRAFGMEVIAYNRSQCAEGAAIGSYVTLEELLERSDVISLHCPLFPETEKIINAQTIGKMKDGVMLCNTARGGLVDEEALDTALKSGKVMYAAVDVVSVEPIRQENPLLHNKKCLITPHIAWAPRESRQRLLDCVVENVRCYVNGKRQNVVNGL